MVRLNDIKVNDVNFVNSENDKKLIERAKNKRNNTRIIISILVIFLILGLYLLTPYSKVNNIVISGNDYYSKNQILELLGIDYDTRALLINKTYLKSRIKQEPLIENIDVSVDLSHNVLIEVTMKKAVAYYWKDDSLNILINDGSSIKMEIDMYDNLLKLPLLKDEFTDETMNRLAKMLGNLDYNIINSISEIWKYEPSYDKNNYVRFLMSDGNQLFLSIDAITNVNGYFDMLNEKIIQKNKCMLFLESDTLPTAMSCEELEQQAQSTENVEDDKD